MKVKRMICSAGPASQLTAVSQFIALLPPEGRKHTSPPAALQRKFWQPLFPALKVSALYLQRLARHNGIGSLPSATMTSCCARTLDPAGATLFELGIAQYIPARARTVSNTSTALFMGESPAPKSRAWRSICPIGRRRTLWINLFFIRRNVMSHVT